MSSPAPASRWIALLGVAIASFVGCLDFTIVNTAIPDIQRALAATVGETQWIVTIFVMALSAFMVVGGRLADLYGRRRMLQGGLVLFALASLGAGLAGTIGQLVAFRFVQGLGAAVLYTASAAIVAEAFPEAERGRAIGLLFAGNGLGLALGPVAGGVLVALWGWRGVFLINLPFLALSGLLCGLSVRESRDPAPGGIDWPGLALLVPGMLLLLFGISRIPDSGRTAPGTGGSILSGAALLAAFLRVEARASAPLMRLDLFANGLFREAAIATVALAFFYCAAFFMMPLYLSDIRRIAPIQVGLALLPTTALVALSSPVVGRLVDRAGPRPLLRAGPALLAGSAAVQTLFTAETPLPLLLAGFALMGLGWGCVLGPSTVAAIGAVGEAAGGVAMGLSWTLHNLGGALGLALASAVYRAAEPAGPAAGYHAGMGFLVAVTVGALLVIVWLGRGRRAVLQP